MYAQHQTQDWVKRRIAAPNDLEDLVAKARVAGLYAPFWTFDSEEAVEYWAQYTVGSSSNRRTKTTNGKMRISFDDLLMPASPHVTPLIRDGILHDFDPSALRPYREGYLAGFAAERHHQSVADGLDANEADKRLLIRNRIKQHINKSGVNNLGYHTHTSGIHYRRILLPVWILHYEYKGKPMKVVVSGIDGRTYGERPFSIPKIAAYSGLLSAIAIVIGLAWGLVACFDDQTPICSCGLSNRSRRRPIAASKLSKLTPALMAKRTAWGTRASRHANSSAGRICTPTASAA